MATSNSRRNTDAHEDDLYSTPVEALEAFFDEEGIQSALENGDVFYDVCDGLGAISDYLSSRGIKVYRSDIKKYRECDNWLGEKDFLTISKEDVPKDVTALIFNPPFSLTEEFIDKAHELKLPLVMFNRLSTLASQRRATKFVKSWGLFLVHVFGFRVSCPKGVNKEPTANAVDYAWFQFDPKYTGVPALSWIEKK